MLEDGCKADLLVVISHDFGELAYAYDFISPLIKTFSVTFALPSHIYHANKDAVSFTCTEYTSGKDIFTIYDEVTPGYVLLFSAFLLVPNKIFNIRTLKKFIARLVADNRVVLTSDPFLGFLSSLSTSDIDLDLINPSSFKIRQHILKFLSCRQFHKLHIELRDIPRLAPFGTDCLETDNNCFPYYNPDDKPDSFTTDKSAYWLFVISDIDLAIQEKTIGMDRFVRYLSVRMRESLDLGYKPKLLAPPNLLRVIQETNSLFEYISRCNVIEHRSIIMEAKRVFYWNMISYSIYYRLTNLKPLHFFDRGHTHAIFPRLHRLAMDCYYQGTEPEIIDFSSPLDSKALTNSNELLYTALSPGLIKLHEFPDALEVLRRLSTF